jgi:hypothetical protein
VKLPHSDGHALGLVRRGLPQVCRESPSSLLPFLHLLTPCGLFRITEMSCTSDNAQAVDQSRFWTDGSAHWDAHRVGWAIAGACTVVVRVYLPRS